MHKGFTKTTLGLLAAALLSSSAFAVGPTIDALPNVYITDLTKAPGAVPDEGDGATPATNVYRFTDAFVLGDYVNFDPDNNTVQDLNQVDWLFQEYAWDDTPGTDPARTGSARTIKIGEDAATGQLGFNSATTAAYADVIASTLPNVGNLANGLDFVNSALSPDLINNGTAPSGNFTPAGGGTDAALIELFVAATSVTGLVDSTVFTVYTTNNDAFAEGDLVTFASNIWNPELCIDSFEGWQQEELPSAADTGGTQTPTATVAGTSVTGVFAGNLLTATGTTSLFNQTIAGAGATQFNYVSWQSLRRDIPGMISVPVPTDETIMLVRWTLSADAATVAAATTNRRGTSVQTPFVRLRTGEPGVLANGQSQDYWGPVGLNGIVEANQEVRTYFFAKEGGQYDTAEGFVDSGLPPAWGEDDDPDVLMGLYFDILDQTSSLDVFAATVGGQRLYGLTLSKIEVYSATRADLGTGTVLFNQGVPGPLTLAAGESQPPSDGYAGFNLQWWDSRDDGGAGIRSTFSPAENGVTGSSSSPLTMTIAAGSSLTVPTWDTRDFAASTALSTDGIGSNAEVVTVDNDVLVAVDFWLSSTTPGTLLPGRADANGTSAARVGFQTDIWGGTGSGEGVTDDPDMPGAVNFWRQGRSSLFHFSAANIEEYDTAYLMPATYALQTGARRVTVFFEPQAIDDADGVNALSIRPIVQAYAAPGTTSGVANTIAGNIQIQRVVVTTYDLPALPDAICP